ncbi:MAG: c-type cytochrome [Bacteroidetes bacterium]|nr:c-type cytochrome [Bacteroidota bacterium]
MKKTIYIALICSCIASTYMAYDVPAHFPLPIYERELAQATSAKIDLGRALFYDPILSADSTISCASCHSPYNSFAHTDHEVSHGIHDSIGTRNAPALFNLAWQPLLMWDGASNHLDMQALAPITHPGEMAESIKHLMVKLKRSTIYTALFKKAYGIDTITSQKMLQALTQFQLSLISDQAKYDKVKQGNDTFTIQEQAGYSLFQAKCNACHTEPLFSNYAFRNNGLSPDTANYDLGRYRVTKQTQDSFLFKVPTLRNLSYTYPYMHDGRFRRLNQVLNHYTAIDNQNVHISHELSSGVKLTSNQKADLIAFLLTLNDKSFILNQDNKFPRSILLPTKENQH